MKNKIIFFISGMLMFSLSCQKGVNTTMKQAEILSQQVICKEPGRYIGWPSIAKAANGDILVVFSGDRDEHVCPYGKTQLVSSSDNGTTWSDPVTITDTPMDDRDAGIVIAADGTVIVSWFTLDIQPNGPWLSKHYTPELREKWQLTVDKISDAERKYWTVPGVTDNAGRGHWIRRSHDHGVTWDEPIQVTGNTPHGPILLSDTRLLMIGNDAYHRQARDSHVVFEESSDNGLTWRIISRFPMYLENGMEFNEPHIAEVEPGKLVALLRTGGAPEKMGGFLWQAESDDGGFTWSAPHITNVKGYPPHLLKLLTGELLVVYGYRWEPCAEKVCLSYDNGRHWDHENAITLSEAVNSDLGYPASIQLDDGRILTVFYQKETIEEKTSLMLVTWQLK